MWLHLTPAEFLRLRQLLTDMGAHEKNPVTIYEHNQGCIKLVESGRCIPEKSTSTSGIVN